jgi:hypothetical protein
MENEKLLALVEQVAPTDRVCERILVKEASSSCWHYENTRRNAKMLYIYLQNVPITFKLLDDIIVKNSCKVS